MKNDGSDETLTYSSNKRISQPDTSILKCSNYEFEKTKIKILNWNSKCVKGTKLNLFNVKIDKIEWNTLFNIVYYHDIQFGSVEYHTRL